MRLIVMRHCKSSWATPGLADHERPLNGRGRRSAKALGDWLRARNHLPDLAIVSSSLRTRQTFEGLALACPADINRTLYHASPEATLRLIESTDAVVRTLLVIGHNPGFGEFAWRLARTPPDHPRFGDYPTGSTTVFDLDIDDWIDIAWQKGSARDFVIPRALMEPDS